MYNVKSSIHNSLEMKESSGDGDGTGLHHMVREGTDLNQMVRECFSEVSFEQMLEWSEKKAS